MSRRRFRKALADYAAYWFALQHGPAPVLADDSDANLVRAWLVEELGIWRNHGYVALSLLLDGSVAS